MKRLLTLAIALITAVTITTAQDTPVNQDSNQETKNDTIRVTDSSATIIDVDGQSFRILRKKNNKIILLEKDGKEKKKKPCFNGHWEGVDWGVNTFMDQDMGLINSGNMEVKMPRSMEWSFNFSQYSIGLQKNSNNIGFVTGLGLTFNDYHFENHITLDKVDGITQAFPLTIDPSKMKRTKFTVSYLSIPILFEIQDPIRNNHNAFIQFGVEGGINLGSHTKVRYHGGKDKDHGDFNVNPFRARGIVKIGFGDFALFAKYSFTPLFEKGNHAPGMEVYPFSFGFSFF
ncbi:PorT family protein [Puteibacter caeruleilacunae]|nr:PorT family protein [Puteibacter caeruleilacunae]